MQLPFTAEQFFDVFGAYNTAVWPAQILLNVLGLAALLLALAPRRWSGATVSAILAFLWLWLGLVYHVAFFSGLNPLAYGFGALSFTAGVVFFGRASSADVLSFAGRAPYARLQAFFWQRLHSSDIPS